MRKESIGTVFIVALLTASSLAPSHNIYLLPVQVISPTISAVYYHYFRRYLTNTPRGSVTVNNYIFWSLTWAAEICIVYVHTLLLISTLFYRTVRDRVELSPASACVLLTPYWLSVPLALHMVGLAAIKLYIVVRPQRFLALDHEKLWTSLKVIGLGITVADTLARLYKNAGTTCHPKTAIIVAKTFLGLDLPMGMFGDEKKIGSIINTIPVLYVAASLIYLVATIIKLAKKYPMRHNQVAPHLPMATISDGETKTKHRKLNFPYTQEKSLEMVDEAPKVILETAQVNKSNIRSSPQEATESELLKKQIPLTLQPVRTIKTNVSTMNAYEESRMHVPIEPTVFVIQVEEASSPIIPLDPEIPTMNPEAADSPVHLGSLQSELNVEQAGASDINTDNHLVHNQLPFLKPEGASAGEGKIMSLPSVNNPDVPSSKPSTSSNILAITKNLSPLKVFQVLSLGGFITGFSITCSILFINYHQPHSSKDVISIVLKSVVILVLKLLPVYWMHSIPEARNLMDRKLRALVIYW